MKTKAVQIEGISSGELLAEMRQQFGEVAQLLSPDMYITCKRAAAIAEVTPQTISNWLNNNTLTNHATGNQHPQISLYQLLTIIKK